MGSVTPGQQPALAAAAANGKAGTAGSTSKTAPDRPPIGATAAVDAAAFDVQQPDGYFRLDMSLPYQRQVSLPVSNVLSKLSPCWPGR
jgi:hypothetical protein